MIFKAARMSEGNKLFPVEVELKETCLEIKDSGLFNSVEINYDYQFIENLIINNPTFGYCSFSFDYKGKKIDVHGFTDEDMDEIEKNLDIKKRDYISNRNNNNIR